MSVTWKWLGGYSVRIDVDGRVIYVDPFELHEKKSPPADLILIGNPRPGHCSIEDVAMLLHPGTVIMGPADALAPLDGNCKPLSPHASFDSGGIRVTGIPAYGAGMSFFPREKDWLGFLIECGGTKLYHAGATARIPEMEGLRADVAFLPVSGRIVMDATEATSVMGGLGASEAAALFLIGERYEPVPGFTAGSAPSGPRSQGDSR